jgi:hypothetical protein
MFIGDIDSDISDPILEKYSLKASAISVRSSEETLLILIFFNFANTFN